MMAFKLVLPKDKYFRLNLQVERGEMTKSNRSVVERVFNVKVDGRFSPELPRVGDTSTVHRYDRSATSRCASARCVLRGF
eukprot:5324259-Pleurochrysis_carterae.AAC.1